LSPVTGRVEPLGVVVGVVVDVLVLGDDELDEPEPDDPEPDDPEPELVGVDVVEASTTTVPCMNG
jgi:hypothetical protein